MVKPDEEDGEGTGFMMSDGAREEREEAVMNTGGRGGARGE